MADTIRNDVGVGTPSEVRPYMSTYRDKRNNKLYQQEGFPGGDKWVEVSSVSVIGTEVNTEYLAGKIEHEGSLVDLYYIKFSITPGTVSAEFKEPFPTTATAIIKANIYTSESGLIKLNNFENINSDVWLSLAKDPGFVVSSDGNDNNRTFYCETYYITE
jgi:hypothetical protein